MTSPLHLMPSHDHHDWCSSHLPANSYTCALQQLVNHNYHKIFQTIKLPDNLFRQLSFCNHCQIHCLAHFCQHISTQQSLQIEKICQYAQQRLIVMTPSAMVKIISGLSKIDMQHQDCFVTETSRTFTPFILSHINDFNMQDFATICGHFVKYPIDSTQLFEAIAAKITSTPSLMQQSFDLHATSLLISAFAMNYEHKHNLTPEVNRLFQVVHDTIIQNLHVIDSVIQECSTKKKKRDCLYMLAVTMLAFANYPSKDLFNNLTQNIRHLNVRYGTPQIWAIISDALVKCDVNCHDVLLDIADVIKSRACKDPKLPYGEYNYKRDQLSHFEFTSIASISNALAKLTISHPSCAQIFVDEVIIRSKQTSSPLNRESLHDIAIFAHACCKFKESSQINATDLQELLLALAAAALSNDEDSQNTKWKNADFHTLALIADVFSSYFSGQNPVTPRLLQLLSTTVISKLQFIDKVITRPSQTSSSLNRGSLHDIAIFAHACCRFKKSSQINAIDLQELLVILANAALAGCRNSQNTKWKNADFHTLALIADVFVDYFSGQNPVTPRLLQQLATTVISQLQSEDHPSDPQHFVRITYQLATFHQKHPDSIPDLRQLLQILCNKIASPTSSKISLRDYSKIASALAHSNYCYAPFFTKLINTITENPRDLMETHIADVIFIMSAIVHLRIANSDRAITVLMTSLCVNQRALSLNNYNTRHEFRIQTLLYALAYLHRPEDKRFVKHFLSCFDKSVLSRFAQTTLAAALVRKVYDLDENLTEIRAITEHYQEQPQLSTQAIDEVYQIVQDLLPNERLVFNQFLKDILHAPTIYCPDRRLIIEVTKPSQILTNGKFTGPIALRNHIIRNKTNYTLVVISHEEWATFDADRKKSFIQEELNYITNKMENLKI